MTILGFIEMKGRGVKSDAKERSPLDQDFPQNVTETGIEFCDVFVPILSLQEAKPSFGSILMRCFLPSSFLIPGASSQASISLPPPASQHPSFLPSSTLACQGPTCHAQILLRYSFHCRYLSLSMASASVLHLYIRA